jgi:protein tyrosine phosphatase (PTP) superfamily phosphohydrolase (DUF442 family)
MEIAKEYGITLTSMPLEDGTIDVNAILKIADYVNTLDHRTYIHNFKNPYKLQAINMILNEERVPFNYALIPDSFENGELHLVGLRMILGPTPTPSELKQLQESGIQKVVELLGFQEKDQSKHIEHMKSLVTELGLNYEAVYQTDESILNLYSIAQQLKEKNTPLYVFRKTPKNEMLDLYRILSGMDSGK